MFLLVFFINVAFFVSAGKAEPFKSKPVNPNQGGEVVTRWGEEDIGLL